MAAQSRFRYMDVGVDRISALPDFIIHQILAGLSRKEVARTCVLSKAWYHFGASYPVLEFYQMEFTNRKNIPNFIQAVDRSLSYFIRNKLGLHTLCLCQVPQPFFSHLDTWVKAAGVKNLKIMTLSMFILPQQVYFSKTLQILDLSYCVLDQPLSLFTSIREISLLGCYLLPIVLSNTDCPFLQVLDLTSCQENICRYLSVNICNLQRLRLVHVNAFEGCRKFAVASHNLQSLQFNGGWFVPWSSVNIGGCDHLKLRSNKITDSEFHYLLSKLPLLEELYLIGCNKLKNTKISCPCLKTLEICFDKERHTRMIEIAAAPKLKTFIYVYAKPLGATSCVVKMADCCGNLETLVLYNYSGNDRDFHDLISRLPLLECLWILDSPKLQSIIVPNVRFSSLKDVQVESPNLVELCYTGSEEPDYTVAGMKTFRGFR